MTFFTKKYDGLELFFIIKMGGQDFFDEKMHWIRPFPFKKRGGARTFFTKKYDGLGLFFLKKMGGQDFFYEKI